jgi:hypothetical protein
MRFFALLQNPIRFAGKILNPLAEKPGTKTKSAKIKRAYIDVAGMEIS